MLGLYWFLFAGGAIVAVLLVLFDSVLGWLDGLLDALPDFLHPLVVVGGITSFGGAGVLLETYTSLGTGAVAFLALLAAAAVTIALFFFYVKPMSEAESSVAYSMRELPGKIGEVTVSIPAGGYGEVGFTVGHGRVYHTAKSSEDEPLAEGEKVLAIDVEDGVVTVCRWTDI